MQDGALILISFIVTKTEKNIQELHIKDVLISTMMW